MAVVVGVVSLSREVFCSFLSSEHPKALFVLQPHYFLEKITCVHKTLVFLNMLLQLISAVQNIICCHPTHIAHWDTNNKRMCMFTKIHCCGSHSNLKYRLMKIHYLTLFFLERLTSKNSFLCWFQWKIFRMGTII